MRLLNEMYFNPQSILTVPSGPLADMRRVAPRARSQLKSSKPTDAPPSRFSSHC